MESLLVVTTLIAMVTVLGNTTKHELPPTHFDNLLKTVLLDK